MATTEINPFAYNTDPTIEEDTPSLEQYISSIEPPRAEISETPSGDELPPEAHALLKTISKRESPDYHTIYGGQKVADLSKHPGIHVPIKSGPNAGNVSSAAGAYQMIKGTWDAQAAKLGLTDFSPRSQDLAAWNLAQETYAGVHNRDLLSDLKSKDPNVHRQIAKTLAKQWTSLPSGIEQGQNADQYIQEYNINLGGEPISTVETYDIPLANGSILQAPKTATRKEALEYARANGIDAIGLQDIPLANGSILHAPENVSVEEALATAAKANPDYDFTPLKIETPSRTTKQAAQDVGITAAKGAVGAVQGLVGLADLITPGNLGQAVQEHVVDLDKIQKHLTTQFSPQQQEALNNISNAHGFTNILQAVKDNPTGVLEMIGEAVPQMVGGGLGAKAVVYGLEKLATKVPNLASHIAKWGAYEAAGAGEGAMQAGVTKENLRVINPEGEQTGANTAAALGTGAGTALFGALGAKATTALGGVDPTVLLSGQARKVAQQEFGDAANTPGFFKSALVSMIGEGGFQEAPQSAIEQMFQNYATNKPILDGVEDATTKGLVTGALMGGGAHIASNLVEGQEPSAPEGAAPEGATEIPPTAPKGPAPKGPAPEGTAPEGTAPEGTAPEEPAPEGTAPEGTAPEEPAPEGTAPEVPPTTPEGTTEIPPTTPEGTAPEAPPTTEEIPEPTVRKTDERQAPEDKHWVDTLGLTPASGIYKQLKQLDVNDIEQHPYIKDLLDTAARKNMKQDPAAVENLYARMDAMSSDEAINKRTEFAQPMGYATTGAPDNTLQEQAQPNTNEVRETITNPNEQVQPNANKISEATTPNVSSSAQPEIRQEGQSAPISSEGVREGRPETAAENTYSIAPTESATPHTSKSLAGSLSPEMKKLVASGKAVIHDTQETLPGENHPVNVQGMTTADGVTHYVANKLTPETIQNVALHEMGVHVGMEKMVGPKVWENIKNQAMTNQGKAFDAARAAIPKDTPAHLHAEEALAYLVEKAPSLPIVHRVISAVRNWARTTLGTNLKLTEADARHLATKALRKEASTAERTARKIGEEQSEENRIYSIKVPPELQEQAKILADAGLVKTSDKTVLDTAKEAFKNIVNKSPSGIYTRLQTSIVDSGAGLRKALSSLDTFDLNGKLRADMLHSKNQQIFNVINTSFKTGILKFSTAGGLIATDNKNLALRDIFKRIDSLGYADNRSTFFTLMRTLAGEQILRADAINRGKARGMLNAAKDLELFSNMIQDKVQYKKALEDAADLRKEANKILNKIGADVSEGIGREKLVQDAHIQAAKALMAQDARLGPIMADIYSVLDNCVDLWEQSGLVNKDTAKMWRENPAYLPLYKSMDDLLDDPMEYVNFLKSSAKSENKVHTLKGGTHAVNAGENLVKHITFMSGAAAQNQLRKSAVGQLWQIGAAYSTHPNDKQAVMYKHDGKKYFAHIDDPMTLEALETAMPSLSAWAKNAKEVTKVFRTVTLANPLYWYRQLVRDPIHANLVSQTGIVTPYHALKAFVKILANKSETYNILEKHGVVGAVDSLSDPSQFIKAVASTPGTVRRAGDKWMKYHEAADAATRVAVYEAAVKEAKKRGITNKDSIENFAAMRAREIINFSKVGNAQAIASIRATVPFFSAQLNSMDTLARAATGMGLNKKEAARARRLFIQRATVLATVSALWALRMQDDDEYAKSPDWINSWLVPTGDKHNPFFKIPIPFEAGFAFKVLPELMVRLLSGTITPKEAKKDVLRAAGQLLLPPLPLSQIIKPIAEVATNHDFYTGRPIESVSDSRLTRAQRDSKASDLSKFLAKGLPISPDNIEHLGRGYLTELWAVTAALAEPMLHTGPATPEKYLSEMPFLKGIFTRPDQDSAVSRLYDVYQTASEMHNTVTHARKVGEKKTAEELMTDPKNVIEFKASHDLTHIVNRIGKLRTNIERIKNTPDNQLTPTEKKNRIQIIQRQINAAAEQGLATAKKRGLDI